MKTTTYIPRANLTKVWDGFAGILHLSKDVLRWGCFPVPNHGFAVVFIAKREGFLLGSKVNVDDGDSSEAAFDGGGAGFDVCGRVVGDAPTNAQGLKAFAGQGDVGMHGSAPPLLACVTGS